MLVFVSCLLGIVFDVASWKASASFRGVFKNVTAADKYDELSNFVRWAAVQGIFSALEFFCVSLSKLAVIDRMLGPLREVYSRERNVRMVRLLSVCERIVLVFVLVSNTCGVCCRIAAAVFYLQVRGLLAGGINIDMDTQTKITHLTSVSFQAVGLQFVFLFTSLLAMIIVFLLAGVLFRKRFRAYAALGDGPIVVKLQRRVYWTVGVLFASFLTRMCYVLYAATGFFGYSDSDARLSGQFAFSNACLSDPCSSTCYSTDQIISNTIVLAPSIYRFIWLLSGPLTMAVALWGMRPKAPQGNKNVSLLQNNSLAQT